MPVGVGGRLHGELHHCLDSLVRVVKMAYMEPVFLLESHTFTNGKATVLS